MFIKLVIGMGLEKEYLSLRVFVEDQLSGLVSSKDTLLCIEFHKNTFDVSKNKLGAYYAWCFSISFSAY